MNNTVIFRVDGNPELGLGHLMRCISLANMLKERFEIKFVSRLIPDELKDEFVNYDFRLQIINTEGKFFNLLKQDYIVVLDGYDFDSIYQKQVKTLGCKLVCIDDIYDKEFYADLIINHAPGVLSAHYKAQPYTHFALGPDYALLRPSFLEEAKKERKIEKIEKVFICFGGSDYQNFTESTLKVVVDFSQFKQIIVVTGSGYIHLNSLSSLIKSDQRIIHYHAADENLMLRIMQEANLAIVPASGILFEVLSTGMIAISGYHLENQKSIYLGFRNLSAIHDAGTFNHLVKNLNDIFVDGIPKKRRKIIDGFSKERFSEIFNNLLM